MKQELPRTASILLAESSEARSLVGVEATHGGEADATSLGLVLPCVWRCFRLYFPFRYLVLTALGLELMNRASYVHDDSLEEGCCMG
jgi:hypothetical protein